MNSPKTSTKCIFRNWDPHFLKSYKIIVKSFSRLPTFETTQERLLICYIHEKTNWMFIYCMFMWQVQTSLLVSLNVKNLGQVYFGNLSHVKDYLEHSKNFFRLCTSIYVIFFNYFFWVKMHQRLLLCIFMYYIFFSVWTSLLNRMRIKNSNIWKGIQNFKPECYKV